MWANRDVTNTLVKVIFGGNHTAIGVRVKRHDEQGCAFAAAVRAVIHVLKGDAPLLLALALFATGCAPLLSARPACERNPALVAAVDWPTVDLVEIHITRKGFAPHQVELQRNQPAVLRVANADDRPRVFNAPQFFPAAALGNITVDDQPIAELCPDAIDIPPNSILDITVIPLQSGRFPFGGPDIPVKSWGSGLAVMYVEGILIVK